MANYLSIWRELKMLFNNSLFFFKKIKFGALIIFLINFINISELYACEEKETPLGKITIYAQLQEEFGSLFEMVGADKKVIMGSGFGNSCNTLVKNKGTFNTFVTEEFGPRDTFLKLLPNPFQESYGTTLHYHRSLGLEVMPLFSSQFRAFFDEAASEFVHSPKVDQSEPKLSRTITMREEFSIARMLSKEQKGLQLCSSYSNTKGALATFYDPQEQKIKLLGCSWSAPHEKIKFTLDHTNNQPLCYGELGEKVLVATNRGDLYSFEFSTLKIEPIHLNTQKVSFQFYSLVNYYDSVLLGHYPSGNMYQYNPMEGLKLFQEEAPGVKNYGRELQSIALSGGQIYAGIWPWSEIWSFGVNSKTWSSKGRGIEFPKLSEDILHPYHGKIETEEYNVLGQRITNLVPYKNYLFASTSSKSGKYFKIDEKKSDPEMPTQDAVNQYGSVVMINTPRNFSTFLPKSEIPLSVFEYIIYPQSVDIICNETSLGQIMHTMTKTDLLGATLVKGEGMFGRLKGNILQLDKEIY